MTDVPFAGALATARLLTPAARVVLRALTERGATALALGRLAMEVEPNLPGAPRHTRTRSPVEDYLAEEGRTWFSRKAETEPDPDAALARVVGEPVYPRVDGYGGVLPELEEHPAWKAAIEKARAALAELELLQLIVALEVRRNTPPRWTPTSKGSQVGRVLRLGKNGT